VIDSYAGRGGCPLFYVEKKEPELEVEAKREGDRGGRGGGAEFKERSRKNLP